MEQPRKRSRWWILIVIVILLLLCLLAALFIYINLPRPQATPLATPALTTNQLNIVISAAAIKPQESGDAYFVRANTDLTLQSQDKSDHICLISGSGIQPITVQLNAGVASKKFRLPVGKYQLTCDGLTKRILVITAQ